jgi:hypothetical protein
MTKQQQQQQQTELNKAIQLVVEAFWEFESGWGASDEEKQAAKLLERYVSYTTDWGKKAAKS